MSRAPARTALGLAALAVGTLLAARYGFATPAAGLACLVVAAYGAALVLRLLPRGAIVVAALLAVGVARWTALSIHQDLRGERPDTAPMPDLASIGVSRSIGRIVHGAPDSGPARIMVWGDCRGGVTVFERLCDEIRKRGPEFSIGLGDFVGMARTYQFEILGGKLEATGAPALMTPGNHDLDPFGTLRPYSRVFGPLHWSFEWKRAIWIGLDTAREVVDPQELDWLETTLAARGKDVAHVVLCTHVPLWMPASRDEKPLPDDAATKRLKAIAEREKAIYLCSHFHSYVLQKVGNVTQLVTGGAGSRLEDEGPHHCVWMTLGPDGPTFEKIVLMAKRDVSPLADRLKTLHDEGAYAADVYPLRVPLAVLCAALFLGGFAAAVLPRRQRANKADAGTTA